MIRMMATVTLLGACALLGACHSREHDGKPGQTIDGPTDRFAGIAPDETIHFTGTEPFWGGTATGLNVVYTTPENPAGVAVPIHRFAGNNGLALTGELGGKPFDMAITPGACSDGMSDRTYPFAVTLTLSGEQRQGCAWTDRQPAKVAAPDAGKP